MCKKFRDWLDINSVELHIIAMLYMLCDHLYGTLFPSQEWLTVIGRMSFPIYAFMIAEGCKHTSSMRKYVWRLLIIAAMSEIPYDLMLNGELTMEHQNVIWTFLIAISIIVVISKLNSSFCSATAAILSIVVILAGVTVSIAAATDYAGAGVLTVLLFYYCDDRCRYKHICHLIGMFVLNAIVMKGIPYQVCATPALFIIWGYKGKKGGHSELFHYSFQFVNYLFYPLHMLILGFISRHIG